MRKGILFCLLLIISNLLFSQEEKEWKFINKIELSAVFFRIDPLNNIYTVQDNIVTKYSLKNEKYTNTTYSNSEFGDIALIDVSNPFKILVFYSEFQCIQFLDYQLSEISEAIFLDDLDILESNQVCSSKETGFWVFDNVNQLICHFDNNLKLQETSFRLNSMSEQVYTPIFMLESNNSLYVNSSEKELLIFDNFANLEKTIPINIEYNFSVKNKINYYNKKKNILFTYDFISLETNKIDLNWKKNILDAQIEQKNLYIFTPKGIEKYK